MSNDRLAAGRVVYVTVGVNHGIDRRLRITVAQVLENRRGGPVLGSVNEQHPALALEGRDVSESGDEDDTIGDRLGGSEVEECSLLFRETSRGGEVENLCSIGHRAPPLGQRCGQYIARIPGG